MLVTKYSTSLVLSLIVLLAGCMAEVGADDVGSITQAECELIGCDVEDEPPPTDPCGSVPSDRNYCVNGFCIETVGSRYATFNFDLYANRNNWNAKQVIARAFHTISFAEDNNDGPNGCPNNWLLCNDEAVWNVYWDEPTGGSDVYGRVWIKHSPLWAHQRGSAGVQDIHWGDAEASTVVVEVDRYNRRRAQVLMAAGRDNSGFWNANDIKFDDCRPSHPRVSNNAFAGSHHKQKVWPRWDNFPTARRYDALGVRWQAGMSRTLACPMPYNPYDCDGATRMMYASGTAAWDTSGSDFCGGLIKGYNTRYYDPIWRRWTDIHCGWSIGRNMAWCDSEVTPKPNACYGGGSGGGSGDSGDSGDSGGDDGADDLI